MTLRGPIPPPVALDVSSDPYLAGLFAEEPLLDARLVVGPDRTVTNAFVWMARGPHQEREYVAPEDPFLLVTQRGGIVPRVFGVLIGRRIEIENRDQTVHHLSHAAVRNSGMNVDARADVPRRIEFWKRELRIPWACDVHSWEKGWSFAMDHPFFATTDATGRFSIDGLPDGEFVIRVWHETFGETDQQVTIVDGAVDAVGLTLTNE